jgi:3-oxoacyl-(acyl-carrier-protein) synthase
MDTLATSTLIGGIVECQAIHRVLSASGKTQNIGTKNLIGRPSPQQGARALQLAGDLPGFEDYTHPTIHVENLENLDNPDPQCCLKNPEINKAQCIHTSNIQAIVNTSFGILGIYSVVIAKKNEM